MIVIAYNTIDYKSFVDKYKDKCTFVNLPQDNLTSDNIIEIIENLMLLNKTMELVFINYAKELVYSLDTLNIEYTLMYPETDDNTQLYKSFKSLQNKDFILINTNNTLEKELSDIFDWVILPEKVNSNNVEEVQSISSTDNQNELEPVHKTELTLENVINDNIEITEADIRNMRSITNKFRVVLLLQAKSRLNTVLKLCNTLDKLYDELTNRIDQSIATADTASLMYTTDYIAKALDETNKFMMTLITNEKLQNFFIIDNSNIINIGNDAIDIDKRERLRKATEIVLNNVDYITEGNFTKLQNPNTQEVDNANL